MTLQLNDFLPPKQKKMSKIMGKITIFMENRGEHLRFFSVYFL